MNRKRKKEIIEHVIDTLKSIRISSVSDIILNDCVNLLTEYHEDEFIEEIIGKALDDTVFAYDLSNSTDEWVTQCTHSAKCVNENEPDTEE